MKIGIIGGTGNIGRDFAPPNSNKYEIILGSREVADATVYTHRDRNCMSLCHGVSNEEAVLDADIVVISPPSQHVAPRH